MSNSAIPTPPPLAGSIKYYERHLLIAHNKADWAYKIEQDGGFYQAVYEALQMRKGEIGAVKITAVHDPAIKRGYDFILYPEAIRYKNIRRKELGNWIEAQLVQNQRFHGFKSERLDQQTLFLVCAHGRRDIRCGECAPPLIEAIQNRITKQGLQNHAAVWGASHVGGHAYAGNVLVFPGGDWYGYVQPADIDELFDKLAANQTVPRLWRGRMGIPPTEAANGAPTTAVTINEQSPPLLRMQTLIAALEETHPDAHCELTFANPLQLLIATILSAQCTDVRVNMVTPALFARYQTAADFAGADREELETLIRSTGFFRQKARFIQEATTRIVTEYGGELPQTMAEMLTLSGVARKTANVVLGVAFGIAAGVVVDTHVDRLAHRFGLTKTKDRNRIERELMALTPQDKWIQLSHLLIFHGRRYCKARKPDCAACPLSPLCPSREA